MRPDRPIDEDLMPRLPLPLAQLYRRAHNAKSARDRHDTAYYLWEAALKLFGSAAVVSYLQTGHTPDARLADILQNLARPAVGHWWSLVRALTVELADRDADFARAKDLLLGRARDDLPRVAGLDAALAAVLDGKSGGRSTVRLTELFDRLVRYRNQEFGHGAVGQRSSRHYEDMATALLAGLPQLLERLDVLAGRRLVYLADVRRLTSGAWLIERYELSGETPRRLESLERTHTEAAALLPQQVYLSGAALVPLHPLVAYEMESNEFLFLNARRGKQRVEYLCYSNGRPVDRVEPAAQNALLAQLLDMPVDDSRRQQWQARSHADETASGGEEPPEEVRRTLGGFELLSELGRGGMGVVYRAWQPSLGRQVALKSLLKTGDAKAEKRFAREIAALGHVEHPHLIRIFTSGSEGERWFYAMELVEGATLALVCDRLSASGSSAGEVDLATWRQAVSTACEEARRGEKPLSDSIHDAPAAATLSDGAGKKEEGTARTGRAYVRHVVELMRQTAEAAHALHEKGIIHRDIKPGNIMVGGDGASATLMDLGLAQVADETESRLTKTRQFVGTLRYASPEQVLAVARLDRRSDVYSLGATLWELLALRPLFGATDEMPTPELMQKIQIEEPGRVRRHNPEVPRDLAAVVDKCLQKDPKKRYATAAELAEELSAFLTGKTVKARPVTGPERLWKWARRRPAQAVALVMTVLTLVSLAVGGTWIAWQAEQARREAEGHAQKQERLRKEADDKRDEADRHRREAEKQKGIAEKQKGIAEREKDRAEKAEKESRDEAEQVKKERDRIKQLLAHTSVRQADRELELGHFARAQELLDEVPTEMRHWEWGYLRRKAQGSYCTLYGHTLDVTSVAFSPDGRRLASADRFGKVKVWDAATGGEVLTFKGGENVAFSPDSKWLAGASDDKTVKVWDAATGQEVLTLKGHNGSVTSVAFSPDGKRLASGSTTFRRKMPGSDSIDREMPGELKVWDTATGAELLTLKGHTKDVTSVAFSPDGKRLASASKDQTVKLWDVGTGEEVHTLKGHTWDVLRVAYSPDGKRLASASDTVKVWDATTGQELRTLRGHNNAVSSVAFSPDGRRLASTSGSQMSRTPGEVKVWDTATWEELRTLYGHTDSVFSVAFSPDGRRLASGSEDQTVKMWDVDMGGEGLTLKGHTNIVTSENFIVTSVAFSPDGRRLASASEDKTVKVWDLGMGGEVLTLKGHTNIVSSVAFNFDGRRLASGSEDKTVKVWDAATGQEVHTLKGHTESVLSVAFSPDGRRLASASWDKTVKVWDAATGQEVHTLKGHSNLVMSVAFSPDGRRLASASWDKTVKVWDAATGQELRTLKGHTAYATSVAFSPDGRRLASASGDKTVKVWEAATGQEVLTIKGPSPAVISVAFSPDGRRLAGASADVRGGKPGEVKVWETAAGGEVHTLKGHNDRVSDVVFSPDGKRLASASDDAVRVWDAASGREVHTLKGHFKGFHSVAFSRDGNRLASDSYNQGVTVWDAATGQEVVTLGLTGSVYRMAFSADGKTLWGEDYEGQLVKAWDLTTGKKILKPGTRPPYELQVNRRDLPTPLLALPIDEIILLIDVSPPDANELGFRQARARFDPFWHDEQAAESEKKADWFAAAFHRGQLAEHSPADDAVWKKLEHACDKLGDYRPALAVCDRLLQRDPSLISIDLRRSAFRLREKNK